MTMMMRGRMSRLARILHVEGGVDEGWHRCRGACEMKARRRRGLGDLGNAMDARVFWNTMEQVKNGDACLICGLGCCMIGVMVHEKRNYDCSVREDEQSFQAQAT
ncbi:uncharacterized protein HKW66_Vig0201650 [Vigna angularis]|uniref:Uncharacterized protein n=1 Tax=Phaseolus angularis TaxID=3914 RepID=A0A8T0JSQ4_PHAAN|nr:uncharacterized protein HKW66_Vig0201650 [Vigna angularis]